MFKESLQLLVKARRSRRRAGVEIARLNLERRNGFTLIELLVAIAVIGILIALALPAVQAAREAARQMRCRNHLKQIGLAFQNHESMVGYLPSSGWGWNWVGDPDAGFDERQPGGWTYNILPFIEQTPLREVGQGMSDPAKATALARALQSRLEMFNCPSRRTGTLSPTPYKAHNADYVQLVAKSDYAVNCGDQPRNEIDGGPPPGSTQPPATPTLENGISYRCSKVRFAHILDGTTHTIAVGEKYLALRLWETGQDIADNENVFAGYDNDNNRSTNIKYYPPRCDASNIVQYTYGSIHRGMFHVVMCDGSVRPISIGIAQEPYQYLGNRNDQEVFDW